MAIKKDGTYGGLVRRKKKLEDLIYLKTRRLAWALADVMDDLTLRTLAGMSDSELRRVAKYMMMVMPEITAQVIAESGLRRFERQDRLCEKREGGA